MLHISDLSTATAEQIIIGPPPTNLGALVRDQLSAMSAAGFGQFDVRWNRAVLSINAEGCAGTMRRVFNGEGICVMERITRDGIGVQRYFDVDGITPLSEEIYDISEDR